KEARIDGVADRADAGDGVVELEMAITVPGECRHPVAGFDAKPNQGVRQLPDPLARGGVTVTMEAAFHGLRHDFNVGIRFGGEVDHARDQQRSVHHHAAKHEHILPGMLYSLRVTSRPRWRQGKLGRSQSGELAREIKRRVAVAVVETQRQGEIIVIRMDNPPVNALGHALRRGLEKAFAEANADAGVAAIVLTGTGRFFSAGADITEFKGEIKEPRLPQLIDKIEAGTKPVVAAINGPALGCGLELALGCHYRVAAKDVRQLGLPETKLGLIPGAGGTQRLPRAVGVEQALQMITTGAFIDANKAAAIGLIDKVADGDVVAAAIAFAKEQIGKEPTRIGEKGIDKASIPADLFEKARAAIGRHPSGPIAPKFAIDAVEAATKVPLAEGKAREGQIFQEVAASPYARALQYAFFAERQAANLPGIASDAKLREV